MSNDETMKPAATDPAPVVLPSDHAIAEAILRHLAHRREAARLAALLSTR
jgi:hypothetical protein